MSLGNALALKHENTIGNRLAHPLGNVVISLSFERHDSVVALAKAQAAHGRKPGLSPSVGKVLATDRTATDKALEAFRAEADDESVQSQENDEVRRGVGSALAALRGLTPLRDEVDAAALTPERALGSYTDLNQAIDGAFDSMAVLPDRNAQQFGQSLSEVVVGSDVLSQEHALIVAAAEGPGHRLSPIGYAMVVQDMGVERFLTESGLAGLPNAQSKPFRELQRRQAPLGRIATMQKKLLAAGPTARSLPFSIDEWTSAYNAEEKATSQLELDGISGIFQLTAPPAHRALVQLLLAGLLGLIALVTSVVLSVRLARSLVGDVRRLRESARNLTDDQLRDVVGRLRRGESVDVDSDRVKPRFLNREMAELGESFDALQLTAVELAGEDIRLHRGIRDVFLHLARRSQVLVHRQLNLLDEMERRQDDPQVLEQLFQLDQLATRMRRYAESLITVSGATAGRTWRHPVPVIDVVRGAIAETEQYARVDVLPAPPTGIAGRAAADVIHLLAELVENALSFSPEDSQVRVGIGTGAGGLVIEVDDRGLGLSDEQIAAANERITMPLDISAVDSTRLGLVTVGRLAQRHSITVTLRRSPYGGVTAVVLIPNSLLEASAERELPASPEASRLSLESGNLPSELRADTAGYTVGYPAQAPQDIAPIAEHNYGFHSIGEHPYASPGPGWADGPDAGYRPDPHGTGEHLPTTDGYAVGPMDVPMPAAVTQPVSPIQQFPPSAPGLSTEQGASEEPDMIDGLPRRVRQASLAAPLGGGPSPAVGRLMDWSAQGVSTTSGYRRAPWQEQVAQPGHEPEPQIAAPSSPARPDSDHTRHPERADLVRNMMSALQTGARRGRSASGRDRTPEPGIPHSQDQN
ncbi:nitrate- and nitrite sensing domain-containing protein [Streptomyces sp. NPDC093228]|uniref:sensor histidine kinase n=1 Tax=Streptomyces sp. NPDC093228 TaxID=3155070 RepID=UPI0034408B8F